MADGTEIEALRSPAATSLPDAEALIRRMALRWTEEKGSNTGDYEDAYRIADNLPTTTTPAPAQPEAAGDVVEAARKHGDAYFATNRVTASSSFRAGAEWQAAHPSQAKLDGMEDAAKVAETLTEGDQYRGPNEDGSSSFEAGVTWAKAEIAKRIRALSQQEQGK